MRTFGRAGGDDLSVGSALDAALASEVRAESTVESLALIAAFDLRVVHYVFEQANA